MSTIPNQQLANTHAFFDTLNAQNLNAFADLLALNLKHEYFPATFAPADGQAKRDKEGLLRLIKDDCQRDLNGQPVVIDWTLEFSPPLDIIQGVDAVVFYVKGTGMSKWGKPYNNEYIFTFRFEAEKICGIREFVDSKYAAEYFAGAHP
ncbi:hypothetical protein FB45DRAFT_873366 [Roridomyces roridus]|uniref:SnoaL-like domain-containing protein n=1 Tax=Roridomyces roridus TaxID=1738132 RepID=A0AAD7FCT2_9AGAR|nr:hypothetical protein FB45DRAFT_873366 [Roridomyces roridus]